MSNEQPIAKNASERPGEMGGRPSPAASGGADELVARRPDAIEAWSRIVVVHLLWIGAGAAALALQFARTFRGLYLSQAMDLAQLGRHLAAGEGYVTSLLRPMAVALYHRVPAPEVVHAPLYPFILGLVFGVLPDNDAAVAGVSALFFIASLPLIYLLASRMFDRAAGVLAAVLFALSMSALGYAVSGLHVTLWAFLLTLMVFLLYGNPGSLRRSLIAGAVLGLCWLSENMTIALVIPALAAAYYMQPQPAHRPGKHRRAHLVWFVVGLVIVMAPWWVRNFRVSGNPFFSLDNYQLVMYTTAHPGHELFRSTDTSVLHLPRLIAGAGTRPLIKKGLLGLGAAYRTLPPLVGIYIIAFFVIAMIRPLSPARANLTRKVVFSLVAFMVVIGALYNPTADVFFVLAPLATVLCAGYLVMLVRAWISASGGRAAALVLLVALAAYPAVLSWIVPQPRTTSNRVNFEYLRRVLPEKAVVVSDAPWAVAWYAQRPAVWLPLRPQDFEAVEKAIGVEAIYFTTLLQTYPPSEQALMWQQLYFERATPPGFVIEATLPPGELLLARPAVGAHGRSPLPAPRGAGGSE